MQMGLYVHFPFCISKCNYCDFNSRVAPVQLRRRYLSALMSELQSSLARTGLPMLESVFFGGGTPTVYGPEELGRVLAIVSESGLLPSGAEITCEANPDTVTAASLSQLRVAGFNRISLGVQSLCDTELVTLGRSHDSATALAAVEAARNSFDNLAVDLIYGIPGQTSESWGSTLRRIIALGPDHISAYGLMIEPNTALHDLVASSCVVPLSDEVHVDLYVQTRKVLTAAGYEHYEISNYARPGRRCRHNMLYWRNEQYLGFGAGAAQYLDGVRSSNLADPHKYCDAIEAGKDQMESQERLDCMQRAGETIMLGLRMSDGVNLRALSSVCGADLEAMHRQTMAAMVDAGIAIFGEGLLRLTPDKGFLLHSQAARRFLVARTASA